MKKLVLLSFLLMPALGHGQTPESLKRGSVFFYKAMDLSQAPVIEPPKLQVPEYPSYSATTPEISTEPNNGKYRLYVPALDRTTAVLLAPYDVKREDKIMQPEDIDTVILKTAYHLSRIKVRVILFAAKTQATADFIKKLKAMGADMAYIEPFYKTAKRINHVWFRDFGMLPVKNIETGAWDNITMTIEDFELKDLETFVARNFGMRTFDSFEVGYHSAGQLRGGNIMMDDQGRCFSARYKHPLFKDILACKQVITFPCRSTVCHVDEYVSFLKNNTVVTSKEEFIDVLKQAGYENILTVPDHHDLSFTNVLVVNDHVLMMYVDEFKSQMEKARSVYESQGYTVIPIKTGSSGYEYGAIHCLTKEIPAGDVAQ